LLYRVGKTRTAGRAYVTEMDGPSWDMIATDIRGGIASGKYPLGQSIPSTPKLAAQYGVSKGPVRQAVDALRAEGLLAGRPGKAVYVAATPADVASERQDIGALSEQIRKLRADFDDAIGRLEANLIELYGKTGNEYPWEDLPADADGKDSHREQRA
jgi:DNA-binding FadR family transcriptional regulator